MSDNTFLKPAATPLSVAIVGSGIIGINHARAIARHPDLTVTAVIDTVGAVARRLADLIVDELDEVRPAEYSSLADALAEQALDLVVICTPSGLHVQLAEEALAGGCHVVIEKPLDVAMPRARHIAQLAEKAEERGLVVSVISQHRFDPSAVAVARAAHGGDFGRLTSGVASVAWWRSQEYYDSGQWRGTWALDGGGAMMNQGVHTVDLLVWFLGRPVDVFAHTALLAHERIEVEDVAVATIRFESGALAVLHATTAAYPGLSVRIQIHGSGGSAIIDNDQLEYFHSASASNAGPGGDGAGGGAGDRRSNQAALQVAAADLSGGERESDSFIVGHLRQYADIVDAIQEGRPPAVRVEDALLSLAVVRAIYASATVKSSVAIDDVLAGAFDDILVATEGLS
jgi:UDP-N-acetyl-2-amino-2-deoxyglucuronate dehydrogenase